MLNGESSKVPFYLSHLRKILNKFWLFGLTLLFHMIFDDLGIALDQELLAPKARTFLRPSKSASYSVVLLVHLSDGSK
jgi:hypothetical protein